ncbi:hypothetical protein [Rossellomorea marisflavi]|uniref:hypothetical protein n=1 Tax=Rossellomorea marisflavi TaxID=189381 RepID=UPI00345AEB64
MITASVLIVLIAGLMIYWFYFKEDRFTFRVGQVEFDVENHSTASRSSIQDEVTHAYEAIMGEVKGDYNPASPISLEFHNKKDISFSTRDEVVLFKDQGHFLTVHELSHALLWGKEEQDDRGYWALEGLAIHLQTEYGDPVYPNYDVSPHAIMNVVKEEGMMIPLTKLCGTSMSRMLFQPSLESDGASRSLQWISYIESASFVSYLIDEYGMEEFEKVFNEKDSLQQMKEVYGKDAAELEEEWLAYIDQESYKLSEREQKKVPGLEKRRSYFGEIDERYIH